VASSGALEDEEDGVVVVVAAAAGDDVFGCWGLSECERRCADVATASPLVRNCLARPSTTDRRSCREATAAVTVRVTARQEGSVETGEAAKEASASATGLATTLPLVDFAFTDSPWPPPIIALFVLTVLLFSGPTAQKM
jgi:hypothetical protein